MYKVKSPVPFDVEIERFFDKQIIDNGDSQVTFFSPNPSNQEVDNNYSNNPLSENYNHVLLGVSIDILTKVIRQDSNIDPAYVVNNLNDGVFKLSTNRGRTRDILHPLKDYLNLNDIQIASTVDNAAAGSETYVTTVTVPTTGLRSPDNLFLIKPQESWNATVTFNSGTWPTTANWTSAGIGRFGLMAEFWFAKMSDEQLEEYVARMQRDTGYNR